MQSGTISRRKIIIAIAIAALVIMLGGAYTSYAMLDWFKDPKTIYLQSELKEIQKMNTYISDANAEYKKMSVPYLDKPVHTTTELSNLVFDAANVNPDVAKVLELIKDAKLQTDLQVDDKNKKTYNKAKLILKDKPIIQLELFTDQDKLGLSVHDIYNKYAVMDLKESEKIKKDLQIPESMPNKIISYNDLMNAVKITPEEIKPFLKDYGKFYSDSIDAKQVTINKDAVFEEEGVKLDSREITVNFTESEFKKLLVSISEKLSNDKALQEILFKRYQNVVNLLKDAGYKVEEINKETFAEKVKDAHFNLKDSVDKLKFNEDAKMVIHIDRKGNILSRTLSMNVSSQDEKGRNSVVFKTASWTDKEMNNGFLSFRTKSDDGEGGEITISYSNQDQNKEKKGKVDMSLKETTNDTTNTLFSFHNDFTIKGTNEQKDGEYAFKASFNSNGADKEISGVLNTTVAQKENGQNADYRFKVNVDKLVDSSGLKSISFKLSNNVEYGKDVQLPALTADNSIDLVHMTEADKTKAQQDIMKGIGQFTEKNSELMQSYLPYMTGTGKSKGSLGDKPIIPINGEASPSSGGSSSHTGTKSNPVKMGTAFTYLDLRNYDEGKSDTTSAQYTLTVNKVNPVSLTEIEALGVEKPEPNALVEYRLVDISLKVEKATFKKGSESDPNNSDYYLSLYQPDLWGTKTSDDNKIIGGQGYGFEGSLETEIEHVLSDFPKVKPGESKSYTAAGKILIPVIKGQENYLVFQKSDVNLPYEDKMIYFKLQQ